MLSLQDKAQSQLTNYGSLSVIEKRSPKPVDKSSGIMASEKSKKLPQIVASFAATIGAFGLGTGLGWSSPALPYLSNCNANPSLDVPGLNNCTLPVSFTEEQGSWIGSMYPIGCGIAGILTGLSMAKIGRKWTMIGLSLPCILGWICLLIPAWAKVESPSLFYVGRLLSGIGGGGFALASPIYISEVTETSIRGAMGSMMQFMLTIGMAFVNAMGIENAVDWVIITGLCILFPILGAVVMFFMPETPYFLVVKGKEDQSEKALQRLRGKQNVKSEVEDIKRMHQDQLSIGSVSYGQLFTDRIYVEPLIIMMLLMVFQQFSGVNAVLFYLKDIFKKANTDIDPGLSAFIIALVQVLATGVAVLIVDKFGRKLLLVISDVFMCLSIFALGSFFYLDENKMCAPGFNETTSVDPCKDDSSIEIETVGDLGWLPLLSLTVYISAFSLGFGPLPWAINAELFPQEAKSKASSLLTMFSWTCAFIVSKFQSNISTAINASGSYFLFGSVCALGTLFVLLVLPETKGKTNEDMRVYFMARAGRLEDKKTGIANESFDDNL